MSAPPAMVLDRIRAVVAGAQTALGAAVPRINDLNVYPVPDGDTGTNLARTVEAVVEALGRQQDGPPPALARAVARAALMGARGNSGIILSQVVRGLCDSLAEQAAVDGATVSAALRGASDAAYRAVRQPVEGTMLTVIREMAEGAEGALPAGRDAVLDAALARGRDALARTPELLDVLREAGVVDAGGAGLVELLRGAIAGLRDEDLSSTALSLAAAGVPRGAERHEYGAFRYCTSFLVDGPGIDAERLEGLLSPLGDSLVVVPDADAVKVHLHTDDPGAALSAATPMGTVSGVDIANMHVQADERNARLGGRAPLRLVPDPDEPRRTDVVVVVTGTGNRRLVESEGARVVVEGGPTMNPSTQELIRAIDRCAAPEVVLLPNDPNVLLAAEQAAAAAARPVVVVPTASIGAGLAAMIAFDSERSAVDNAVAMAAAASGVRTGGITAAVRDATANGVRVRKGDFVGLLDGQIVAATPQPADALRAVADRLLASGGEVLTVLRGDEDEYAALRLDDALTAVAAAHPDVEIEVHDGGQPYYPVLLSAE